MAVLGYNVQGAKNAGPTNNTNDDEAQKVTTGSGFTTATFNIYCANLDTSSHNLYLALYADNAGVPGSMIGTAQTIACAASFNGLKSVAFVQTLSAATVYWLAFSFNSGQMNFFYDDGTDVHIVNTSTGVGLPDPWSTTGDGTVAHKISIWLESADGGGGLSIPVAMKHYRSMRQ